MLTSLIAHQISIQTRFNIHMWLFKATLLYRVVGTQRHRAFHGGSNCAEDSTSFCLQFFHHGELWPRVMKIKVFLL